MNAAKPNAETAQPAPRKKGTNAPRIRLTTSQIRLTVSALGARMCALDLYEDSAPNGTNIAIGLSDDDAYMAQDSYIGAVCGRYANRIENSRYCDENGAEIRLAANEGATHLHGGIDGFDKRMWAITAQSERSVSFTLTSPDGDQGYRGTLVTTATYSIVDENRLRLEITATCDQTCPVNMTSHAYWNLTGKFDQTASNHILQIDADQWLPVNDKLIPLDKPQSVDGTGYDFRNPQRVADMLPNATQGFDHNFCLNGDRGTLRQVATLSDPDSGRSMKLFSTEPGLQFYLAQHFTSEMKTQSGIGLHQNAGIALEPQTYPNSPNRPDFPSPWIKPGETYQHVIEWEFS